MEPSKNLRRRGLSFNVSELWESLGLHFGTIILPLSLMPSATWVSSSAKVTKTIPGGVVWPGINKAGNIWTKTHRNRTARMCQDTPTHDLQRLRLSWWTLTSPVKIRITIIAGVLLGSGAVLCESCCGKSCDANDKGNISVLEEKRCRGR